MSETASLPAASDLPKRREYLSTRHGVLNVLHVLATHALLIAWFIAGYLLLPLVVYLPVSLLACVIHQRAMSEWIHEGAHANFVPNRTWNDRLTDMLAGMWFLLPVRVYRAVHLQHHRQDEFFVENDPDTVFLEIETRAAFWWAIVRDLTGITMIIQFLRFRSSSTSAHAWFVRLASAVALAVVGVLLFLAGRLDALLLYYLTLATLYPLLNRLRTYGQHVTITRALPDGFAHSAISRTIDAGIFDRILHTSPRLMYHHEHHRYPHLPYRALRPILVPSDDVDAYTTRRLPVLRAVYAGLPSTRGPSSSTEMSNSGGGM
jgi:fatty acid desaturase